MNLEYTRDNLCKKKSGNFYLHKLSQVYSGFVLSYGHAIPIMVRFRTMRVKKPNWFSFWLVLHITKSVSTLRIGGSGNGMIIVTVMPIISHGNNKTFSQIATDSTDS